MVLEDVVVGRVVVVVVDDEVAAVVVVAAAAACFVLVDEALCVVSFADRCPKFVASLLLISVTAPVSG